jgi:hypothetical protein
LKIVVIKSNINITLEKVIHEQSFKLINYHKTKNIEELHNNNNNSSHIILKYVNEIRFPYDIDVY